MTSFTRLSALMSMLGSPSTAIRSASILVRMAPTRSPSRSPKSIDIAVPVLDLDVNSRTSDATIRLEFKLPTEPKQPVTFQLLCPEWNAIRRARIDEEITRLKGLLGPEWTIVRGVHREVPRTLPK